LTNLNWTEIFAKHPELSPLGYEEAVRDAIAISEQRYAKFGKKRAKGGNSRKVTIESRQATDARRGKFPSLKHGQQL